MSKVNDFFWCFSNREDRRKNDVQGLGPYCCAVIEREDASALYIFIGAKPFTDWLGDEIIKNDKGFIETGRNLHHHEDFKKIWKLERDPYLSETSCPGIFAAGDVRAGAMNRFASAVGDGSMAISFVHKYWGGDVDVQNSDYTNYNTKCITINIWLLNSIFLEKLNIVRAYNINL